MRRPTKGGSELQANARKDSQKRPAACPVVIDAPSGTILPTPRVRLKSLDAIRLEMARVYRAMKQGDLDPSIGTKLAYVLAQIGKLIVDGDIEKRVRALECIGEQHGKY